MNNIRKYLNKKWIFDENYISELEKFFNRNDIERNLEKEEMDHPLKWSIRPIFFYIVMFIPSFLYLWITSKIIITLILDKNLSTFLNVLNILVPILFVILLYIRIYKKKHLRLGKEKEKYLFNKIWKYINQGFENKDSSYYDIDNYNFYNYLSIIDEKYQTYKMLFKEKNFLEPLYNRCRWNEINSFTQENFKINNFHLSTYTWWKNSSYSSFKISKFYFPNYNLDLDDEIVIKNDWKNEIMNNFSKNIIIYSIPALFLITILIELYFKKDTDFFPLAFISVIFLIAFLNKVFVKYFKNRKFNFKNKKFEKNFDIYTKSKNLDFINDDFIEILKNFRKKMDANFMISKNTFYVWIKYSEFSLFYKKRTFEEIIMDYYIENKIIYDFAFEIENFYKINSKKEN